MNVIGASFTGCLFLTQCLTSKTRKSFRKFAIIYHKKFTNSSLQFAWVVEDAKCTVVTRVCLPVCLSAAACPHYCTDPDVTWGSGRGCPLVVHYFAYLQSVHGLRCYGNITRTRNVSEYMLVLALWVCLVNKSWKLSSCWDGRPFGHNRHGPKSGRLLCPIPWSGSWVSI